MDSRGLFQADQHKDVFNNHPELKDGDNCPYAEEQLFALSIKDFEVNFHGLTGHDNYENHRDGGVGDINFLSGEPDGDDEQGEVAGQLVAAAGGRPTCILLIEGFRTL
jgi:hypothetical protein